MTSLSSFLILLVFTLGWLALPLLPALNEWRRKTDITPLRVVREYDGNVRFFARGFRDYVTKQMDALPSDWETRGSANEHSNDVFPDGSPFCVLRGNTFPVSEVEMSDRTVNRIVLARASVDLPSDLVFAKEVFASHSLRAGNNSVFRAILSDGDLVLGDNNSVYRWLHCEGSGTVGASSTLYGRASSDTSLSIGSGCAFQRLHAPRLVFSDDTNSIDFYSPLNTALETWLPDGAREQAPQHYFVQGDVRIPRNVRFDGNIVSTGTLLIGAGAQVNGSTKSHGDTLLERGSRVYGSIVSAKRLKLNDNCYVSGPLIAEGNVTIGAGCQLGNMQEQTTVSAPEIEVCIGTIVYGTMWAREIGKVISSNTFSVRNERSLSTMPSSTVTA